MLIILPLTLTTSVASQIENEKNFFYREVFQINMKKEKLKENINTWMVKTFTNTNNGIKLNSDDNLIARGTFRGYFRNGLGAKESCSFDYVIQISFKNGRYRLTMSDFAINPDNNTMVMLANWGMIRPCETLEDFIIIQKEFMSGYGIYGKAYLKRLDKPKKVRKDMIRHKKYFDIIEPQIKEKQKKISNSLLNYLKERVNDDW